MSKAKVVITGGAGFIGSHLARRLVERGVELLVYDDLSTGVRSNVPKAAKLIEGNTCDFATVKKALRGADFVFHLAALVSVPKSVSNPRLTEKINVGGTVNVLAASLQQGVKKVFLASSGSVYGDTLTPIQSEETPLSPRSPYALSKVLGELWCKLYSEEYGLPTVVLRYFNVYGGSVLQSNYSLVVPRFIRQAHKGEPLTIYGDGCQTRDYVHVDDVVDATILSMYSSMTGVYNVGTGIGTSVNSIADYVKSALGSNSPVVHEGLRLGDQKHACADIRKIVAMGWYPKRELAEEIRKMCDAL